MDGWMDGGVRNETGIEIDVTARLSCSITKRYEDRNGI